ncbi:MAG TPA: hypothetical protein VFR67_18590 [Pilimelia sp.]|nr:hypothetical protein [Pilimelia sp.]
MGWLQARRTAAGQGAPLEPGRTADRCPSGADQVDAAWTGAQGAGQATGRVQVR